MNLIKAQVNRTVSDLSQNNKDDDNTDTPFLF